MRKASEHGRSITPMARRPFAAADNAIAQRHDLDGARRPGDDFFERPKIGGAAFTCRLVLQQTYLMNDLDAVAVERECHTFVMDRPDWNGVLFKWEEILIRGRIMKDRTPLARR
jgi:hypothetical protein